MKILAIEKELKSIPKGDAEMILKEEALKVWELKEKELIREIYFTEERCAVLILECKNLIEATTILKELPLVQNEFIRFDLLELHPYTGFKRLF